MNRLVIVGSSRKNGRCARIATDLFETCIEEYPDDGLFLASVASLDIRPCQNCGGCRNLAEQAKVADAADGADGSDQDEGATPRRCVIDDDMHLVYEAIEAADETIVISPVFFAGPPAQLKALLDRLQPYFWLNTRHRQPLHPATLHIIGEGHDPIGYDPLIGCVTSALLCAGFELDTLFDWVGKLAPDGTILDDPDEYALYGDDDEAAESADAGDGAEVIEVAFAAEEPKQSAGRPKLDLNADQRKGGSGKGSGSGRQGGKSSGGQGSGSGKQGGSGHSGKSNAGKSGGNKGGKPGGSGKGSGSGKQGGGRSNQNAKGGKPRG